MAKPAKELTIDDLSGFKQLRRVATLLSALHDVGCERDKAGNRELHYDDYVMLVLLALMNPLIDSMRVLQQVADLPEVQIRRVRLGGPDFRLIGSALRSPTDAAGRVRPRRRRRRGR